MPAVLAVHDDRVEALVEAPLRGALAGPRFARQDVVRGDHEPAGGRPRWQQVKVERLHREPLEVHDVGVARETAVAEHVGHVLGELQRRCRAGPRAAPGAPSRAEREPVEVLAARVAVGLGRRAVA